MKSSVVKITIWGKTVGYIYWDESRKTSIFEYDKEFVSLGLEISPLNMPVQSVRSKKGLPWYGDADKLYQGLPPMIADSLPDKWGNSIFNAWMRNNKVKNSEVTPIDKLSFIGSRAMGAFEYEPARQLGDNIPFDVNVESLYQFAKDVLNEREGVTLRSESSILWQDLIKVGGSPGGRVPKALIAINTQNGDVKSGQANVPEGFAHYLLKYDSEGVYPYTKVEYIYYLMATHAGIDMMPSELRDFGSMTNFITQRFDRIGNHKIHTQTLAAMMPEANDYDDLFTIIRQLNLPYKASEQQYLRMVFNVLSRNVDDHSKNFSFCMEENGQWSLSPAYDITYSIDNSAPAYVNKQSLFVNGKDAVIAKADLLEVAKRNDISDATVHIERVTDALSEFHVLAKEQQISKDVSEMIEKELLR